MKLPASSSRSTPAFPRFRVGLPLLLLGALLFYGLISLPVPGETSPTFHVASRYLDRGAEETGFNCAFLGVLLEYRNFDLMLFSLFFLSVTLSVLLFALVENLPFRSMKWGWAVASLLSSLALMALGWIGLISGSNFMDEEFWSGVFGSAASTDGGWITGALVLLAVVSSLTWAGKIWVLGKEKRLVP